MGLLGGYARTASSTPGPRCWWPTRRACGSASVGPGAGLPWGAVEHIEHTPRRGPCVTAAWSVSAHNEEKLLAELDAAGRRQARVSTAVLRRTLRRTPRAGDPGRRRGRRPRSRPRPRSPARSATSWSSTRPTSRLVEHDEVVEQTIDDDEPRMPAHRCATRDRCWPCAIAELAVLARREATTTSRRRRRRRGWTRPRSSSRTRVASATPLRCASPRPVGAARLAWTCPSRRPSCEGRELRRPGSVSLVEDTAGLG